MAWKHNNAPHRKALNFGKPGTTGIRMAKHAKGTWWVGPIKEPGFVGWQAWRAAASSSVDLGHFPTEGLAMSACARDFKEQP